MNELPSYMREEMEETDSFLQAEVDVPQATPK